MKKKSVVEQESSKNDVAGLGENPIKLVDKDSGNIIAYVGKEQVYFNKTVSFDELESVLCFVQKKKFHKHLSNERFEEAQEFANRKF